MSRTVRLKVIDYIVFAVMAIVCFLMFLGFHVGTIASCFLYLLCGLLIYKISVDIGMGKEKSKLCTYATMSMPIGFAGQFILGQSTIALLFFVLLGFFFWLRDEDKFFLLFFAIAFLFGGAAFPIFVTLLLLKQKELKNIAINVGLFLIPALIKVLISMTDSVYREKFFDFSVLDIKGPQISVGALPINLTIVIALFIIAYSYTKRIIGYEERVKWSLYLVGLQMFAMFGLGGWEPQQLLFMVPFFTFSAFIHKDTKIFMVLDLALMLFFVLFTVDELSGIVDDSLALSFFSVLVLIIAVFKHPKDCLDNFKTDVEKGTLGFIRGAFIGGVAIYVVPAVLRLLT